MGRMKGMMGAWQAPHCWTVPRWCEFYHGLGLSPASTAR